MYVCVCVCMYVCVFVCMNGHIHEHVCTDDVYACKGILHTHLHVFACMFCIRTQCVSSCLNVDVLVNLMPCQHDLQHAAVPVKIVGAVLVGRRLAISVRANSAETDGSHLPAMNLSSISMFRMYACTYVLSTP
jgi:hypothetical protein